MSKTKRSEVAQKVVNLVDECDGIAARIVATASEHSDRSALDKMHGLIFVCAFKKAITEGLKNGD